MKVGLFGKLFAARTDIYAVRWENARTGRAGWLPAVHGGWRKGIPHAEREYLPLTAEVLAAHLSGQEHIGLYPLLDGDRCWWLAADFDGSTAPLVRCPPTFTGLARTLGGVRTRRRYVDTALAVVRWIKAGPGRLIAGLPVGLGAGDE